MTTQAVNQSTDLKPIEGEINGKFWINEEAFCLNTELQPLITKFQVKGIRESENKLYYTPDHQRWVREDFLFKNKYSAYRSLMKQAEIEMRGELNETQ